MSYKIAFISNGKSFIVEAIAKGLAAEHVESIFYNFNASEVESLSGQKMIVFLSLDDMVSKNKMLLSRINEMCSTEKMPLYIMGYAEDVASVKEFINPNIISGEYKRPINTRNVVEGLMEGLGSVEKRTKKKIILLVDDSGTVLHAFKEILEPTYTVYMCNSGREVLTFLRGRRPDLILLDHEMPGMSGPETLAKIHENERVADIPVMFLTGKSDSDSVMQAIGEGPQGYLLKSMSSDQIMKRLEEFFESRY